MLTNEITQETKQQVWDRQNGMCAFSGKKFIEKTEENYDYYFLETQEGVSTEASNIVLLWKSAELFDGRSFENNILDMRKYHFPYANFENYGDTEIEADLKIEIDINREMASKNENLRKVKNKLKDVIQFARSMSIDKERQEEIIQEASAIIDDIISKEKEANAENAKVQEDNFNKIKPEVDESVNFSMNNDNFKEAREKLIQTQKNLKDLNLSNEQRQELYGSLNKAFDDLNYRQTQERENYEMECIDNYHRLKAVVIEACKFSEEATQFRKAREKLINAQKQIKGQKLKRDQREELYQNIRTAFENLNERQDKEREEFEKACEINYTNLKKVVDEAITAAKNSTTFKEAREALIGAQGAIKGMKLKRDQRDGLYAAIREVFDGINKQQEEEREQFEAESKENYEKLNLRIEDAIKDIDDSNDFKLIRETLITIQSEVKILKLKRAQRNELFDKIRAAFSKFDDKRDEFKTDRLKEKSVKLRSIQENLKTKIERLDEALINDKKELEGQLKKSEDTDSITTELQQEMDETILALKFKIKEKEDSLEESKNRIADIENELSKIDGDEE